MWKCELCQKEFDDETMAVEVRFGYVDSEEAAERGDQYDAFYPESGFAPLCDDCAVAHIKGEETPAPSVEGFVDLDRLRR